MSNSARIRILEELERRCDGSHERQQLTSGRVAAVARYPSPFPRTAQSNLAGVARELRGGGQSL
eukprot:738859-Lingulodinium_polyedra.AAC.1